MIEFEDQTESDDGEVIEDDEEVIDFDEEIDDDAIYGVMVGDISNGYRLVGPFGSFDIAHAWSEANIGVAELTWILPVCNPYSPKATKP